MTLIDQLNMQLKEALKNKDTVVSGTIRMLLSAIHNVEIELHAKGKDMQEDDVLNVLRKELKKRQEATEAFAQANREDQAAQEAAEAAYIAQFLPQPMPLEDVRVIVENIIQEKGEVGMKDFGAIVKETLLRAKGRTQGDVVSKIVKELMEM